MSHRTQITLTDEQYGSLKRESDRSGMSIAELVRRALRGTTGFPDGDSGRAFEESFGAWKGRAFSGAEYVEMLRPGLGTRLDRSYPGP